MRCCFPRSTARADASPAASPRGLRGEHAGGTDAAEVELLRRRLRQTRRKVRRQEEEIAGLGEELRTTRASLRDPDPGVVLPAPVVATIQQVRREHLSYLSRADLVEAGTARGGSAIVMAAAKAQQRSMVVYDVFGMIPPPSEEDGEDVHRRYQKITRGQSKGVGGGLYYGYRDDLYEEVRESFGRCGVPVEDHRVDLVRGLFQDTIHLDEPVALAHLTATGTRPRSSAWNGWLRCWCPGDDWSSTTGPAAAGRRRVLRRPSRLPPGATRQARSCTWCAPRTGRAGSGARERSVG